MSRWPKYFCIALVVVAMSFVLSFFSNQRDCCLCNRIPYHAPCLIDLESGDMIELDLYFPNETNVAELVDPQPYTSTFSFIHLGNIVGSRWTEYSVIDFDVPISAKVTLPSLCRDCRKMLPVGYTGRYALADLYDLENKTLYPIEIGSKLSMRCYEISMMENSKEQTISVIIQGTLDIDKTLKLEDIEYS